MVRPASVRLQPASANATRARSPSVSMSGTIRLFDSWREVPIRARGRGRLVFLHRKKGRNAHGHRTPSGEATPGTHPEVEEAVVVVASWCPGDGPCHGLRGLCPHRGGAADDGA